MALKSTIADMKHHMQEIMHDLEKSEKGNRAAAQRARTHSIKLAKIAKVFRKESIAEFKKTKKATKTVKAKKAPAKKKPAAKKKGKR